jgi:hypothetical protein
VVFHTCSLSTLRQEDLEFKASLSYLVRLAQKQNCSQVPVAHSVPHSVILATQEADIRRTAVLSQPGQIVSETLS